MEGTSCSAPDGLGIRELTAPLPNEVVTEQEATVVTQDGDVKEINETASNVECALDPEHHIVVEPTNTTDTSNGSG